MRIDQLLVQRGLASTRSQAQRLIASGVLWQQGELWRKVAKNGDLVPADAALQLHDAAEARYVSRGGLKLQAALNTVGLSVLGLQCLDVGQSTGGFTDCLLQHGAHFVVGVDVGSAQLHPRMRADPRVLCIEGLNARALDASYLIAAYEDRVSASGHFELKQESDGNGPDEEGTRFSGTAPLAQSLAEVAFVPAFDLIVVDLSFISQTLVLPAVLPLLKAGGTLLTLVKPQFELQPGQVGKGGIVKDTAMYIIVEQRLRQACAALGLTVTHWFDSSITGGDGNREFFVCAHQV